MPMLAARVEAAAEAYARGRARRLLLTGDGSSRTGYDEPAAMARYAIQMGVAEQDLLLDRGGLRTYDSCYRARSVFGIQQAIVVTDRFHLPRAVLTATALGLDVVGLEAPARPRFTPGASLWYGLRESMAVAVAMCETRLGRPPRHRPVTPSRRGAAWRRAARIAGTLLASVSRACVRRSPC